MLKDNDVPFVSKEFRQAFYTRSRLRNNFSKNTSKNNERLYKKQRNRFVPKKEIYSQLLTKKYLIIKTFGKQ